MSFTHTTLKQAIQDWTENSETTFVNNLDIFIQNAEERILKMVDLDFFRKNVTASFVANNPYLNVPSDYLASFSLGYTKTNGDKEFLMQKDVNFLQEYSPDSTDTGEPKYYAIFDVNNFILAPTPDSNYAVELHYFYRPNSITAPAGTSWLGDNSPNTLLYGSLVEAYTFMKGEADMLQLYETRFLQNIARLKNYGEGVENTDAYREGLVRIPKT
jgi:Fe-S cluster assembly iron-binding protein IscA